jgi:hypothetical protein
MPRGVPLTPDQIAEATRVYLATGNYSEAARAIGSDVSNVRRQLIAAEEPTRAMLHTQALARAERDALRALVTVRKGLVDDFAVAAEPKDRAALSAQVHDNARATTQMRVAHAKLTGDHAPDKHAHTVEADDVLASKLARLAAAAATGEDPR